MGNLHEDQYTFFIVSCSVFSRAKIFQTEVVETIITRFMFKNILSKIMPFSGQAAGVDCVLDTEDYKHTLKICNTYCYCKATMVA